VASLLRAGHTDFVLNAAAFNYMRTRALPASLITQLSEQPDTVFADQAAWSAHLNRLGFTALTSTPEPVQITTEGLGQHPRAPLPARCCGAQR
jgi:hypothetical protein